MADLSSWLTLPSWLSAAVIVSVGVFLAREWLERRRRKQADARKRRAMHRLLRTECHLNDFAAANFQHVIRFMKERETGSPYKFMITKTATGGFHFNISSNDGVSWNALPIPALSKAYMDRFIIEAALVDEPIFDKLLMAHHSFTQLEALRDLLIEALSSDDNSQRAIAASGAFLRAEKLESNRESIVELLRACSGKDEGD